MRYEWKCTCCKETFTVERKVKDFKKKPTKAERAPWCSGKGWTRVIHASAIRTGDGFKG